MRGVCAIAGCTMLVSVPSAAQPAREVPSPTFVAGPHTFAALAGKTARVRVAWAPVTRAARYRATWSDGNGGPVDVLELPAATTAYERPNVRPGHYQLEVVAIDEAAAESVPAMDPLEVVAIDGTPPGADASSPTASTTAFAVGTRFSAPGFQCALDGGAPAASVAATAAGKTTLRCARDGRVVEVGVIIAPVLVATTAPPLPIGQTTQVHVTVASVAALGDKLEVSASGADIGDPGRTSMGITVPVTPRRATITLAISAGDVELGKVELATIAPGKPVTESAWFALELGGQLGALLPSAATYLGRPRDPHDSLAGGPTFGGRAGLFVVPRLGLETELALATPGYTNRAGSSAVAILRGQLAARVVEDHLYGLRLLAGGEALDVLVQRGTSRRGAQGAVHYGTAFTIETRRDVWLRLEALHVLTTAQDGGYASCFELSVGVVTRLGRRDRWW
jgi:hypothetical protein